MENKKQERLLKVTPAKIVGDSIFFRIPLYQRLFTWSAIEITQLLDDLYDHFKKHKGSAKPYYLGMITVMPQTDRWDLIDGQQRLTAILLLSLGFIRYNEALSCRKRWQNFFGDTEAMRIYFNGRSEDRDFLKRYSKDEKFGYENPHMAEGLAIIRAYLEDKSRFHDTEDLNSFGEFIFENLTLFVTKLPDNYAKKPASLNEYFEAMNSSGKSLEQHEILKVNLLRDQPDKNKLNFTRLWNIVSDFSTPLIKVSDDLSRKKQITQYKRLIGLLQEHNVEGVIDAFNDISKSEEEQPLKIAEIKVEKKDFSVRDYSDRESGVLTFPQFLLMVLAIHRNDDKLAAVSPSKLLDTFKENPLIEVGDFYEKLILSRLILDLYVVRMRFSSSAGYHYLINRDEENAEHINERLRQFQSMFEVSTEPHRWILPLLKYIQKIESNPSQKELFDYLKKLDNAKHNGECPKESDLMYEARPRYWLWRLDYALWEKLVVNGKKDFNIPALDDEAVRQYEFRRNRSIEHLHPQNETLNEKWTWENVNSFGNLAMISQSFNSTQSNLPVHVKFANIEVQITNRSLQSIKMYLMYLKAKCSEHEWTPTAMKEHQAEMLAILEESINN